jgi:AAA15 family ATPase/GTPase
MNNHLNTLEINNYKSIKHLKFNCKRVNVFIGKPNVGKSNILEAISLLGAQYSNSEQGYLKDFLRYQEISNLFYDDDLLHNIQVISDKVIALIRYHANNMNVADLTIGNRDFLEKFLGADNINEHNNRFHKLMNLEKETKVNYCDFLYQSMSPIGVMGHSNAFLSSQSPIRKYSYTEGIMGSNKFPHYLLPPFGDNLFSIVDHNKELRIEIANIFKQYGLNFVGYKKENTFEIEKNIDGYVTKYHYQSIADTFKRLIFYFAAIDSNKGSVLVLEEPEVHSFPPYTKDLSQRIIDSTSNQFFITTHSPYLLNNFVESMDYKEFNLFITYFENYQTKIKKLSQKDLDTVLDFGIDLFYNLDSFTKNE